MSAETDLSWRYDRLTDDIRKSGLPTWELDAERHCRLTLVRWLCTLALRVCSEHCGLDCIRDCWACIDNYVRRYILHWETKVEEGRIKGSRWFHQHLVDRVLRQQILQQELVCKR